MIWLFSGCLHSLKVHTIQNEADEGEILAIIPVFDFVHMVHAFKQVRCEKIELLVKHWDGIDRMIIW